MNIKDTALVCDCGTNRNVFESLRILDSRLEPRRSRREEMVLTVRNMLEEFGHADIGQLGSYYKLWKDKGRLSRQLEVDSRKEITHNIKCLYVKLKNDLNYCSSAVGTSSIIWGDNLRFANFEIITEDTFEYIVDRNLLDGVVWLHNVAPDFFPGAYFHIDLLPASVEGEEDLLTLKVFGSFDTRDFRERRHRIGQAMIAANLNDLYTDISIFQRRISNSGWQKVSYISEIIAE